MPSRARPAELDDEAAAPPPARRPRCEKFWKFEKLYLYFSVDEANAIEPELHIDNAIGKILYFYKRIKIGWICGFILQSCGNMKIL